MNLKRLCFILPVYNEAASLPALIARLESIARRLEDQWPVRVGFIFVDDGSQDDSFAIVNAHDFGPRAVKILQFSRNFGKEAALSAGIDAAHDADAAILMDSDLQHPPEMAEDFVRIWLTEGMDGVYAYKSSRQTEGQTQSLLARLFYKVINTGARYHIPENAGDFRLMNHKMIAALHALPESQRFMKGLYGWIGFRQKGLPFTPPPRAHGVSHFRPLTLMTLSLDALTSFTITPLRVMALAGMGIAALSVLYGLYIVIERMFFTGVGGGIASVLTLVAFFGGMQMVFLGLLGEYIGKAVLEAKQRPTYILAHQVSKGDAADRG